MTAVADLTTVLTILKGSAPSNAQIRSVADLYAEYLTTDSPTNEQRAQAVLTGMKAQIRRQLREKAEGEVYAAVIRQPHYPADQPALLAAAKTSATAAGDSAEGTL